MNPDTALAAIAAALVEALKAAPAVVRPGRRPRPRRRAAPSGLSVRQPGPPGEPAPPDDDGLEHLLTLTCASKFGGPEEARAVTAAVRAALHNAPLAVAGRRLVTLRVTYADVFRAADRELSLGVLRVRAVTEAL
jgi:hypothetical protein